VFSTLPSCQGACGSQKGGLGSNLACEQRVGGELGTAVEGDGPAAVGWESLQGSAAAGNQGPGLALDHRGQVGQAKRAAEDDQVRFPVAEALPAGHLGRAVCDKVRSRDERGTEFATVARAALPTRRRQQAVEISSATLMTVDGAVDGLVAEGVIDLGFKLQASGDLLRRPAGLELAVT
jgi:hypothetical protein